MLRRAAWRVYADFLRPSRLHEYAALLDAAAGEGYRVVSLRSMWEALRTTGAPPAARVLVLRHDIDTDPATAAAQWAIGQARDVHDASWFFRLRTLDVGLMQRIASAGGDVGYHYEELADVAKARGAATREALLALVPEARARFAANLAALRERSGLPLDIVASHGDFVNRRFGVPNHVLLDDAALRARCRIALEAYDEAYMAHVGRRHSDGAPPRDWAPESPLEAMAAGVPVVEVLTHPRHWRAHIGVNLRDGATRLQEGVRFARRSGLGWLA